MSLAELPASLAFLARQINAEVAAAQVAAVSAVEHAHRAGELLIQAKEQLAHGEWLPWLQANCSVSERTAQAYMQVARRSLPELKSAAAADLPLRGVLQLLGQESLRDQPPAPVREAKVVVEAVAHPPSPQDSRLADRPDAERSRWLDRWLEQHEVVGGGTIAIKYGLAELEPAELEPVIEALRRLQDALWSRPWRGTEVRDEAHYKECFSRMVRYFEAMRDGKRRG